jgi:translation initiation factor 1
VPLCPVRAGACAELRTARVVRYSGAVIRDAGRRPVWESSKGRLCPKCGWPVADCRCSSTLEQAMPERITAVLRLEKKGRGGKSVTVVAGLPRNQAFLRELATALKRACGSGGAVADDSVEIQGDQRERLRPLLLARGFIVKG